QLGGPQELPVGCRAGVTDSSVAVPTREEDRRTHSDQRHSESRSRSDAGLHAPFFGAATGEAPSPVRVRGPMPCDIRRELLSYPAEHPRSECESEHANQKISDR